MKKTCKFFLIAALVTCIAACASVPLGTMWEMRRMGPEGLINTSPEHVRAAAMSESWFIDQPDFERGRLILSFTEPDEQTEHVYEYFMTDVSSAQLHRLDEPPEGQSWRVYAIESEQLAEFQSMQRQIDGWYRDHEMRGWTFTLEYKIGADQGSGETSTEAEPMASNKERLPDDLPDTVPLRIDLQLIPEDGYFTLIRSARIDMNYDFSEEES